MGCEPQGYKIKVSDFLEANENWKIWQQTRYANTRIQCVETAFNSFLNKYIFRFDYKKIKSIVESHLDGDTTILSILLISDIGQMVYHWREPNRETYYSNIEKAKLIQEDYMWVDWEVLEFVQKNIKKGREANGTWV